MDKQQKLKIALPVLFVIMAFVWGPVLMKSSGKVQGKKKEKVMRATAHSSGDAAQMAPIGQMSKRSKARTVYVDWERNPFTLTAAPKAEVFKLDAILWDEANPAAMINGTIVAAGSRVGPYTVVEVKPNSVILDDGTSQVELR